jgi:hypothetical protein
MSDPSTDDPMRLAVRAMAHHAGESWRTDRKGWTDAQWIQDAEALMDDLDGSVSSLLNGHVLALLRFWRSHQTCTTEAGS